MSNKKPILWLVALNIILFLGFGGRYLHQRSALNNEEEQIINSVAQSYEKLEIIPEEDYRRTLQLADSIKQSRSISDSDLNWWIDLVNRSTSSKSGDDTGEDRRLIALQVELSNLTAANSQQKDRLFELAKSYLPAPGQLNGKDIYFGVSLLHAMNEKRAASLLPQFLNRPRNSYVRQMCEDMLERWSLQQPHK